MGERRVKQEGGATQKEDEDVAMREVKYTFDEWEQTLLVAVNDKAAIEEKVEMSAWLWCVTYCLLQRWITATKVYVFVELLKQVTEMIEMIAGMC